MKNSLMFAHDVRRLVGQNVLQFPIVEIALKMGVKVNPSHDAEDRFRLAEKLGRQFNVCDPRRFAIELLAPLGLIEAACYARIKTNERWFFGLFTKTRGYTTSELATVFNVPLWVIHSQLEKLL